MSAETGEVWIGLRADGVEVVRVQAKCVEVSRTNGIATYKTVGSAVISDLPCDVAEGIFTISDDEHGRPFNAGPFDHPQPLYAGDHINVADITFDRVLDVPRYVVPDKVRLRDRLRR